MDATVAVDPLQSHPERAVPQDAPSILERGAVAHVAWREGDGVVALPMSYHYDRSRPDRLHLHAAGPGRFVSRAGAGAPLSVSVTLVHALVYSRTALSHTMDYESVVLSGRGRLVPDAHLDATGLVEVTVERWNAKRRDLGPRGPRDALAAPGSAGVVPLASGALPTEVGAWAADRDP